MEEFVLEHVRKFCSIVEDQIESGGWSTRLNLSDLLGYLTFDIMGEMLFSRSFDMQTEAENRDFIGISLDAFQGLNTMAFIPLVMQLNLHKIFFRPLDVGMQRYKVYCAEQSDKRTATDFPQHRADVWSRLMKSKNPTTKDSLTPTELRSEAAILVAAASHPNRTLVSALFHYLFQNDIILDRLVNEVRMTFSSVEDIRAGTTLKSCTYLHTCITEALRLNPGLPGTPQRTVNSGGVAVGDIHFPAGTVLTIATYALHHNEDPTNNH
jgi:cytochrome P450